MALLLGLTAALTLAACGVPPSDVIQAGKPATGIFSHGAKPARPTVISLYFVHGSELKPYPREVENPTEFQPILGMLFDGPDEKESLSASTRLPRLSSAPDVTVDGRDVLSVQLPEAAGRPDHLALMQLTCTVATMAAPVTAKTSESPSGASVPSWGNGHNALARTEVHVRGNGWAETLSGAPCPSPSPPAGGQGLVHGEEP